MTPLRAAGRHVALAVCGAVRRDLAVDGFFAVSGFLICRAWTRRPRASVYLRARAARLLPGLWVCLALTALLLVPMVDGPVTRAGQWSYMWRSGTFLASQWAIDGSPHRVLYPSWDGSLWSLRYEVLCYLLVLALGLTRLLTREVLVAVAGFAWLSALMLQVEGLDSYTGAWFWLGSRCLLMFSLGGLLWFFADRIPMSGRWLVAAACVLTISVGLPDYRLLGAPALAYLCVAGSLWLGRLPMLVLHHDVSYGLYIYAFPVQQALLVAGLGAVGWVGFSVLSIACTLPGPRPCPGS